MPIMLVTYEKRTPGQEYNDFLEIMTQKDSVQLSEFSFALKSRKAPEEVYQELSQFVGASDTIYVIPLAGPFRARGFKATNQWLARNLDINIYRLHRQNRV